MDLQFFLNFYFGQEEPLILATLRYSYVLQLEVGDEFIYNLKLSLIISKEEEKFKANFVCS